ncbi:hypothetical protein INS49_008758 [Diaporthe citri]|uniref:uncharacterized protein n=1 Tax=Diaporthe citri TaxID=83186 RepID=UPI001C81CFB7|nr:uncharacterized protein INS49_008758 [Diaporthe citri]KAG6363657.1 hypothetical protein INS49_008758 [Diaporthe citri]
MSRNTWDRERFMYERDRDRDRYEDDDRYYRGGSKYREHSADERYERRPERRPFEDEVVIRDSRKVYYDEPEPRFARHRSPPPDLERDRRVVIERERQRVSSPSPPSRPAFLRRQSSLDTFDRRPRGYHYEDEERERYGPPARREDFRPRPYEPIPLPRTRALPPPRRFAERDSFDEIRVSDPDYYGDEEYRSYPERVREREIIRTKRRDHSPAHTHRSSRTRSHRGSTVRSSSRSSTTTSSSGSSSGGTTVTVKSEYPKKGKTRIPARLASKRALIDLGYPFVEEGNTIVVLKALGQENIDDLLKLSEDYKKSELELTGGRSEAGNIIEERREETIVHAPAPPPSHHPSMHAPPPPPMMHGPPPTMHGPPPPVMMPPPPIAHPPPMFHAPPPPPPPAEVVEKTTVIRDVSPARSYTTTTSGTTHTSHTSRTPYIVDVRREEVSEDVPVGAMALVKSDRHRSRSRSDRDIRHEIRDLERQLDRKRHGERELVKAERLSSGELVLYEEQVERIEEPRRGVRIEKDKKGPPPGIVKAMLATLT